MAGTLLGLPLLLLALLAALIGLFGWNWARAPLQQWALDHTGRVLQINGDLQVDLAWPAPRVRVGGLRFANPAWAQAPQLLMADEASFSVDLPLLLWQRRLRLPELRLVRPVVQLEQAADGRKTWLLDTAQSDEDDRVLIGRLALDQGQLHYDNAAQQTRLQLDIDTPAVPGPAAAGVVFGISGQMNGLPLVAHGSGGPVLALRDERVPYPLAIAATLGRPGQATSVQAQGSITGLTALAAVDLQLAVRGHNLALLYPVLPIALPATRPYAVAGHLLHHGTVWRYEGFTGRVGKSDVAGSLQVETGGVASARQATARAVARPFLRGEVTSRLVDIDDLAALVGKPAPGAAPAAASPRLLPGQPFHTERWRSADADVQLRAGTVRRAGALPLENLATHLTMNDAVLRLGALRVDLAGGQLQGEVSLDGRQPEIRAAVQIQARQLQLARLLPTADLRRASLGHINGDVALAGQGQSVDRMLATADGQLRLTVGPGMISRLLMEQMGLHLLEILQLQLTGDRPVPLRCAVADFSVQRGQMVVKSLVLDTDVSTVLGTGSIDLGQETLALTLSPRTRSTSPLALRSPIHVRGTFMRPEVAIDTGAVLARGAGALALGLLNPLLALIPLVELGPGGHVDCGPLLARAAQPVAVPTPKAAPTAAPRAASKPLPAPRPASGAQ